MSGEVWFDSEGVESVQAWVSDRPGPPPPDGGGDYLGIVQDPEQRVRLVRGMERAVKSPGDRLGLFVSCYRLYLRFNYADGHHQTFSQNAAAVRTVLLREPEPGWRFIDEEFVRDIDVLFPRTSVSGKI